MNDASFMSLAVAEAKLSVGHSSPNPPVGAVVVRKGRVVGRGHTAPVGGPHAEVLALQAAGARAQGATLYTTLEPCNHLGRTPACSRRILDAKIARVVVGIRDENPLVAGRGLRALRRGGAEVEVGVEAKACEALAVSFFTWVKAGRPRVVLKIASTLDGRIATRSGDSRWVSGAEARDRVHGWRASLDAVLVGAGTVRMDHPRLTARPSSAGRRDPIRVILDGRLSTDPTERLFQQRSLAPTWVVCGQRLPRARKQAFELAKIELLALPSVRGRVQLEDLLAALGSRGVTSLMVEGGAELFSAFLTQGCFDELRLFLSMRVLTGGLGFSGPREAGPEKMASALGLTLCSSEQVGEDLLLTLQPRR